MVRWIRVTSNPGVSLSTKNAVMPPRARLSGSVSANTSAKSAWSPPVMKCLRPDTIQDPFVRMAFVWMAVASEPALVAVPLLVQEDLPEVGQAPSPDLLRHVQGPEPQLGGALPELQAFLSG